MDSDTNTTQKRTRKEEKPRTIFISHKVSEHKNIVESFRKLILSYADKDKLDIFISEEIVPGIRWKEKIKRKLIETDIFLLIYLFSTPPSNLQWMLFEAGIFDHVADKPDKHLIVITPEKGKLPPPLEEYQSIEANKDGVVKLLKLIYSDAKKPIREDLFHVDFREILDDIVNRIITLFSVVGKVKDLVPRVYITMENDQYEKFKAGEITLPIDSKIYGETDSFRRIGIVSQDKSIPLNELQDRVPYPKPLEFFVNQLGDILFQVINTKPEVEKMPPVRITKDYFQRIIVPTSLETLPGGKRIFNFVVTELSPNFELGKVSPFSNLFNFLIVVWHFRWRIIDKHLKHFIDLCQVNQETERDLIQKRIKMFKFDLDAILLDYYNRFRLHVNVLDLFDGEQKEIMTSFIEPEKGFWDLYYKISIEELEKPTPKLESIVKILTIAQDLSKTALVITLRRLCNFSEDEKIGGRILGKRDVLNLLNTRIADGLMNP
jgi:hypothetical protein